MRSLLSVVAFGLLSVGTLQAQQPGALGITLHDNPAGGVSIENVVANSPAAQIGLLPGDRILSINDQPMARANDLVRTIGGLPANTPVELFVVRGAWQGKFTAVLAYAANVFSPNYQFVSVPPVYVRPAPASRPTTNYPSDVEEWQFPRNMFDNGQRGAMASKGALGY